MLLTPYTVLEAFEKRYVGISGYHVDLSQPFQPPSDMLSHGAVFSCPRQLKRINSTKIHLCNEYVYSRSVSPCGAA